MTKGETRVLFYNIIIAIGIGALVLLMSISYTNKKIDDINDKLDKIIELLENGQ